MSSRSLSGEIRTLFVAIVASIDHKIAMLWLHCEYRLKGFPPEHYWNVLGVGKTDCAVVVYKSKPFDVFTFRSDLIEKVLSHPPPALCHCLWFIWAKRSPFVVYIFGVLHEISYLCVSQAVVWPLTCAVLMAVPMHLNACGLAKPYTPTPPLIFLPVHNVVLLGCEQSNISQRRIYNFLPSICHFIMVKVAVWVSLC